MKNNIEKNKFHWMYGIEEYLKFVNHPQYHAYLKIVDAIVHGERWAIRDLILDQVKHGQTQTAEQYVNTIMISMLHQDLPNLTHSHILQYVQLYINDDFIDTVYNWSTRLSKQTNINDHFSRGQVNSKLWMIEKLDEIIHDRNIGTVVMYGGWYATVADLLFKYFKIKTFYNLDLDKDAVAVAKDFNYKNNTKFESVLCDVNNLEFYNNTCTLPNSKQVTPTAIINTSCEHMKDDWFYNLPDGQFVVLQTNNYFENEQHTNCVSNIEHALDKYKFSDVLYSGCLDTHLYERYMIIGFK